MSYHTFRASVDASKCLFCNLAESDHVCSVCESKDKQLQKMAGMLYCADCILKEQEAQRENQEHAKQRIDELRAENLRKEQERIVGLQADIPQPDTTIQVITDIHNAHLTAIEDWRKEIESDDSITEKHVALAKRMETRYLLLKNVVQPKLQADLKDTANEIRAIQTYYNDLGKKIREDIRAKIKIEDVKYTPPEKPTKPIKAPSLKKYSTKEIREVSGMSGIPEQLITIMCYSKNCSPSEAVRLLRESGVNIGIKE